MTTKLDDRIQTLETKLQQLKVRQQRIAARKAALLSSRARKEDTRRKILVGAVILAKVEQGDFDERQLRRWLDKALTRGDDRALFGLKPSEA
jgi:hypothetical protein